ncbi:NAD(P)-dependent oxidoreductase [Phreatobacter sp. HK31-P]
MKVALLGASGMIGSRILAELASRGHAVTALARNTARIAALPSVTPKAVDADDRAALAAAYAGHDAAISSVHYLASNADTLIGAAKDSGVARYLVVGGAGSLEVAPGVSLVDTPQFPALYLDEARAGGVFLGKLKAEPELNWTFLSPSALIQPGERTGTFRLGTDQLLVDAAGNSAISAEDYAVALVDELEAPKHVRARFTVGY